MVRVKQREEPTPADMANANAARYIHLKNEIKDRSVEADRLKPKLMAFLEENGEEDSEGSFWMDLPTEVEGVVSLKRERRVAQTVNADRTLTVLQDKGLEKRCYRMEPVLDQDEVMKAVAEGLISDEELAEMFPPKVTWALVQAKS